MVFDWSTAIISVTAILIMVSLIAVFYFLDKGEPRLVAFYFFLFLVCVFILGGMVGCL